MNDHWHEMPNETPFLHNGEEFTYVTRIDKERQEYVFGYLRHADDLVYADYREGHRVLAE